MAPSSGDHAANVPSLSTRTTKHQPTMGLLDAINLLLACIIGSGIFISAKAVLEFSGSYGFSIVVWISCGILCIMGALCYAELGCAYVSSGGDYTYLRVAFGNFVGFLRVWVEVALSRPMIVVLSVLTASNYLVYWFYPTCPAPDRLVKCLSSFLLLIVGFINLTSAKWTNALSAYEILMSDATAVSFAERVWRPLLYIIPIGVTMSCVGAASGNIFTIGQMFNVAGRDGLMPHIFSMKHYETNVPMIAILCELILSFVFLFFMTNIGQLIICVGMINWICILLAAIGLIVLRYKHPDRERPIKIPLPIPILFIISLVVLIGASAIQDVENITTSLLLLATAIPAYIFGVMWKNKPKSFTRQYNSFAIMLQKVFHVVHDEHTD
ncbi:unnamed protein product [Adineta steineri]|uniref:Uncharacterized protein n=1 Tax=Adineta steineri TaxID=433720 RepID=A0A818MLK7_9BILA|nr:unnamed protein product [Adineta steineri]